MQEAAASKAAEAESLLAAAKAEAESAVHQAKADAEAAAASAAEEYANLRRVLDAVNAQKAELEGKVAKAAGALNAAEELKEAKYACAAAHHCAVHLDSERISEGMHVHHEKSWLVSAVMSVIALLHSLHARCCCTG